MLDTTGKQAGDVVSLAVLAGVAHDWLPAIASGAAALWTAIRIYECIRWRVIQRRREPFE